MHNSTVYTNIADYCKVLRISPLSLKRANCLALSTDSCWSWSFLSLFSFSSTSSFSLSASARSSISWRSRCLSSGLRSPRPAPFMILFSLPAVKKERGKEACHTLVILAWWSLPVAVESPLRLRSGTFCVAPFSAPSPERLFCRGGSCSCLRARPLLLSAMLTLFFSVN